MPALVLTRELLGLIYRHFLSALPNEACGILASDDHEVRCYYPMANADPSPVSYHMDPAEQFRVMKEMRQKGLRMAAICHSHPASSAFPSPKDVHLAFYDDVLYLIVSLHDRSSPVARVFRIRDGEVSEAELVILDPGVVSGSPCSDDIDLRRGLQ